MSSLSCRQLATSSSSLNPRSAPSLVSPQTSSSSLDRRSWNPLRMYGRGGGDRSCWGQHVQERQLRWPRLAAPVAVFFHHTAHPLTGNDLDRFDQRSLHSDPPLNSISDRHNPSAHNAGYCSNSLFSRSSVCRFVKQPGKQLSS